MTYDYSKLNGRIIEKCGTQRSFAEKMGVSEAVISKLLNGDAGWRQVQIEKAMNILEIPVDEVAVYFFKKKLTYAKVVNT